MITALAISLYLACGRPQVVYVENNGHEIWLQIEILNETKTNPLGFKFRVQGSKEDIDFHNATVEELVRTNQTVTMYYSKKECYKA